jgi:hypothetical protein
MASYPITQEYLRSILHYDPETGLWTWMWREDVPPSWNTKWAGKKAGSKSKRGYIYIKINRKSLKAHRLAFLYMKGWIPIEIDHENNDPSDNKWNNLRSSTHIQNSFNRKRHLNNKSGYKGVSWDSVRNKWHTQIMKNGKVVHSFHDKIEDAAQEYRNKADEIAGEFAKY